MNLSFNLHPTIGSCRPLLFKHEIESSESLRLVQVVVRKKIRVNDNMSIRMWRIPRLGLPRFAHQSSLTLGLRCAHIDILSLIHVFLSDGDLNKSKNH